MTPTDEDLLPLVAATNVAAAGAKAAALAQATSDGFRVPDGAVITVAAAQALAMGDERSSASLLTGLVDELGGSVAVRSSAVDEDGGDASFAGQYETVLDVTSDNELIDAIGLCLRSAETDAVLDYGNHEHGSDAAMAILVQRMLRPTVAGVAFSADPVTGDDHVVIEATPGVGDALLAGEITGERWVVDEKPRPSSDSPSILRPSEAQEIASLCRRLAERDSRPVDIEWGIEDGELWLLQVRPITALPLQPTDRLPEKQTFVREPRVPAPLHPLSFSSWFPIHSDVFAQLFEEFGIPAAGVEHRHHLSRVYSRTVPLIDRGNDGSDPPPSVLKVLLRVLPPMRRRMASALTWNGDEAIEALIDSWETDGRSRTAARTRDLRRRPMKTLTNDQLLEHIDEIRGHLRCVALDHFRLSTGAMAIPMGRLGLFVEDRLGWTTPEVFTLVQGYGHASVAHSKALQSLIERLDPEQLDRAIGNPSILLEHPAAQDYLDRFGHIVHVELADPTEADDPRIIADHLRRHRARVVDDQSAADPTSAAQTAEARAVGGLHSEADRATFGRLLALARRGRPLGDETEGTVLSALSLMRGVALEVGRRWVEAGRLRDPSDIWFLELDEMCSMLRSPSAPLPDIDRRRRELRWAQTHAAPDHVGPTPPPMLPPSIAGKKYRSSLGAAFWSFGAMEGEPIAQPDEDHLLHGQPGCPGTVTGTARIVGDPTQFGRLEPGDILVCPMTTAAWSPVFGVVGGLVTERGGPLSHPATLAREYGLPAVLSAEGATQRIPDGARVRIEGATGVVQILDEPAAITASGAN